MSTCQICSSKITRKKSVHVKDFRFHGAEYTGKVCRSHHGVMSFVNRIEESRVFELEQHMPTHLRVKSEKIKQHHKDRKNATLFHSECPFAL